ncbi:hypothetical protein ACJX0J_010310, partial [Zea mays]
MTHEHLIITIVSMISKTSLTNATRIQNIIYVLYNIYVNQPHVQLFWGLFRNTTFHKNLYQKPAQKMKRKTYDYFFLATATYLLLEPLDVFIFFSLDTLDGTFLQFGFIFFLLLFDYNICKTTW